MFLYNIPHIHVLNLYEIDKVNTIIPKLDNLRFEKISASNIFDLKFRESKVVKQFSCWLEKDGYNGFYVYYKNEVIAHGWSFFNETKRPVKISNYFSL